MFLWDHSPTGHFLTKGDQNHLKAGKKGTSIGVVLGSIEILSG